MSKITFYQCVVEAIRHPGFVEAFDHLMGTSLSKAGKGSPIVQMVDQATGYYNDQMALFVAFIYETTWTRLPRELLNLSTDPGPEIVIPLIEFEAAQ